MTGFKISCFKLKKKVYLEGGQGNNYVAIKFQLLIVRASFILGKVEGRTTAMQ